MRAWTQGMVDIQMLSVIVVSASIAIAAI